MKLLEQWYNFWQHEGVSYMYKQGYLQGKYEEALMEEDWDTMEEISKLKDQLTQESLNGIS